MTSDAVPSDWTLTTLREFLERLDQEHWDAHSKIHELEAHALKLAQTELARRLDILNHAHEEARNVQSTYLPREIFDSSQSELTKRAETLSAEMSKRAEVLAATQTAYLPREVYDTYIKEQQQREERAQIERGDKISREFFDQYAKEENTKHARVLDQLSVTYSDISSMKSKSAAYTVAIGIFFTIVTISVSILSRIVK